MNYSNALFPHVQLHNRYTIFIAAQVCSQFSTNDPPTGSAATCLQLQLPPSCPIILPRVMKCDLSSIILLCYYVSDWRVFTQFNVCLLVYFCTLIPLPHPPLPLSYTATGTGIVIGIESGICPVWEVKVLNKYTQCALNTFLLLSTEWLSSAGVYVCVCVGVYVGVWVCTCKPMNVGSESFVI